MDKNLAIETLKSFVENTDNVIAKDAILTLHPELVESDDERVRKHIRLCLDECVHSDIIRDYERDECLAYLEKQKEPHYTKRNALFDKCVENCNPEIMKKVSDEVDEMLEKEQKPAEWSEEDKEHINSILERLEGMCKKGATFTQTRFAVSEDKDWLKSLRPQKQETLLQDAIHANDYDKKMLGFVMDAIRHAENYYIFEGMDYSSTDIKEWVLAHFSDQEWSEKDEHMKDTLEYEMRSSYFSPNLIHWTLSHLRSHWKPSEKQMSCLW